jgi:hypothetical protein
MPVRGIAVRLALIAALLAGAYIVKVHRWSLRVAADAVARTARESSTRTESIRKPIEELPRPLTKTGPATRPTTTQEWIDALLNSSDVALRETAIRVLSAFPSEAAYGDTYFEIRKSLLRSLRTNHPTVRALVIRSLKDREFELSPMTRLISYFCVEPDARVRAAAYEFLGATRDPSAVPHAMKGLDDPDLFVFEQACDALMNLTSATVYLRLPGTMDEALRAPVARAWKDWYAANRDRYRPFEFKDR